MQTQAPGLKLHFRSMRLRKEKQFFNHKHSQIRPDLIPRPRVLLHAKLKALTNLATMAGLAALLMNVKIVLCTTQYGNV